MNSRRQHLRLTLLRTFAMLTWRPRKSLALPNAPRILVIRPDHIGDLLFATPALRVLRRAFPNAHLTCMVGPWSKAVLENNPHLDAIITCEFPAFSRQPKTSLWAPYHSLKIWATRLRAERFDIAIVLRFDHWWGALLAYLAGIPRRLGYAIPECKPFVTKAIPYISLRHEVKQNLTLVEQVVQDSGRHMPVDDPLTLEFRVLDKDRDYIAHYLAQRGVAIEQGLVVIHPGAGAPVKQWQPDAFATVADTIAHHWGTKIIITGSDTELDLAWSIYARMRTDAIVAAGDTSLGQLAALFQRSRLVIGPDCGPLHLAVAVGTPTVHLYGPVDPRKFGPWGKAEKHLVVTSNRECIPCNRLDYSTSELPEHPCVREIPIQAVLDAAQKLLKM